MKCNAINLISRLYAKSGFCFFANVPVITQLLHYHIYCFEVQSCFRVFIDMVNRNIDKPIINIVKVRKYRIKLFFWFHFLRSVCKKIFKKNYW